MKKEVVLTSPVRVKSNRVTTVRIEQLPWSLASHPAITSILFLFFRKKIIVYNETHYKGDHMPVAAVIGVAARGFVFGCGWQVGMETVKATSKVTKKTAAAVGRRLPRRRNTTD